MNYSPTHRQNDGAPPNSKQHLIEPEAITNKNYMISQRNDWFTTMSNFIVMY